MEHRQAVTSDLTTNDSNNNNDLHHHHNRRKKRIAKQQQLVSLSLSKKAQVKSVSYTDPNTTYDNNPMKNPLSWRKRWNQWFSSCGSERISDIKSKHITVSIKVRFYLFFFCRFNTYTCCVEVIDCLIRHFSFFSIIDHQTKMLFFYTSYIYNLLSEGRD